MNEKIIHWVMTHQSWIVTGGVALMLLLVLGAAQRAWRQVLRLDNAAEVLQGALVRPIYQQLMPRTPEEERSLRGRLSQAGYYDDDAVRRYLMGRIAALVGAVGLGLFIWLVEGTTFNPLFLILGFLGLAWFLPNLWLDRLIGQRQQRISRVLPSVVDLLVLCLDVGLSLDSAFARVTEEIRSMEPLMADEAQFMRGEMQAGLTFSQALKRMAERVDLEELINLARLIGQATDLGTSITNALREYAEQSFQKRVLALEEFAGKVSAKLVMPLTMCFLPAVMIALVGPSIIKLGSVFGQGAQ